MACMCGGIAPVVPYQPMRYNTDRIYDNLSLHTFFKFAHPIHSDSACVPISAMAHSCNPYCSGISHSTDITNGPGCPVCGQKYPNFSALVCHMIRKHAITKSMLKDDYVLKMANAERLRAKPARQLSEEERAYVTHVPGQELLFECVDCSATGKRHLFNKKSADSHYTKVHNVPIDTVKKWLVSIEGAAYRRGTKKVEPLLTRAITGDTCTTGDDHHADNGAAHRRTAKTTQSVSTPGIFAVNRHIGDPALPPATLPFKKHSAVEKHRRKKTRGTIGAAFARSTATPTPAVTPSSIPSRGPRASTTPPCTKPRDDFIFTPKRRGVTSLMLAYQDKTNPVEEKLEESSDDAPPELADSSDDEPPELADSSGDGSHHEDYDDDDVDDGGDDYSIAPDIADVESLSTTAGSANSVASTNRSRSPVQLPADAPS